MSKTIQIIVSPTGATRVETRGFAGSSCQQASRFLEEALGRRTSESLTPEFHQQQAGQESEQEHN